MVSAAPVTFMATPAVFASVIAALVAHRRAAVECERSAIDLNFAGIRGGACGGGTVERERPAADFGQGCRGDTADERPAPSEIEALRIEGSAAAGDRHPTVGRRDS